jgi:hypothetical protein
VGLFVFSSVGWEVQKNAKTGQTLYP